MALYVPYIPRILVRQKSGPLAPSPVTSFPMDAKVSYLNFSLIFTQEDMLGQGIHRIENSHCN